jgi:hypothetical protein
MGLDLHPRSPAESAPRGEGHGTAITETSVRALAPEMVVPRVDPGESVRESVPTILAAPPPLDGRPVAGRAIERRCLRWSGSAARGAEGVSNRRDRKNPVLTAGFRSRCWKSLVQQGLLHTWVHSGGRGWTSTSAHGVQEVRGRNPLSSTRISRNAPARGPFWLAAHVVGLG